MDNNTSSKPTDASTEGLNIMNNVVENNSKYKYLCENTLLLFWAYRESDNENLLDGRFLNDMLTAELTDGTPAKKKKAMREVCKLWLEEAEIFNTSKCPLQL